MNKEKEKAQFSNMLETKKTILKKYQTGEGIHLYKLINNNRERLKNWFPKTVSSITDVIKAEEFILERIKGMQENKNFSFGIWEKISNTLIGHLFLHDIDWTIAKVELGFYITKEKEGKGLMKEALSIVIKFCFETLELKKILLRIAPENERSTILSENLGFTKEGIIRNDFITIDGILKDLIYYGMTLKDYESQYLMK